MRGAFNVFNATFTPDLVVGRDGFLVGAESTYDVRDGQIKTYNAAVGYSSPEYTCVEVPSLCVCCLSRADVCLPTASLCTLCRS